LFFFFGRNPNSFSVRITFTVINVVGRTPEHGGPNIDSNVSRKLVDADKTRPGSNSFRDGFLVSWCTFFTVLVDTI